MKYLKFNDKEIMTLNRSVILFDNNIDKYMESCNCKYYNSIKYYTDCITRIYKDKSNDITYMLDIKNNKIISGKKFIKE